MKGTELYKGTIPELTGIRIFGMLSVAIPHLWFNSKIWTISQIEKFAWIPMDFFFVLSGFLIAGILVDSRNKGDYYRKFYIHRALRILPPYYFLLLVLTGAMFIWKGQYFQLTKGWGSPFWFFIYVGNFIFASSAAWPRAVMAFGPLWSLQIEEQYYLAFPFIVKNLSLKLLKRFMWLMLLASPVIRTVLYLYNPNNPFLQYVLSPCRLEGFALGALIAIRFREGEWNISKRFLTCLSAALVAGLVLFTAFNTPVYPFESWATVFNRTIGFTISSITCACLVLWLIVFQGSRLTAFLRGRFIIYLGKISYGTYLYHIPVALIVSYIAKRYGLGAYIGGFFYFATAFALTNVCAALSWEFLESPLLKLKDRWSKGSARKNVDQPVYHCA
jgi:peptidoglycan/LPS O-acetylase OafA/YrhL